MTEEREEQQLRLEEVDESLLEWYSQLSLTERLRAASRTAATMERLRRAASTNR